MPIIKSVSAVNLYMNIDYRIIFLFETSTYLAGEIESSQMQYEGDTIIWSRFVIFLHISYYFIFDCSGRRFSVLQVTKWELSRKNYGTILIAMRKFLEK